mmetsp:Transcript_4155/g.13143  ORF Transcript_4155/g.13143 Transcript_4155/m.13143 type:complete len:430 (-) Transcript_4155:655-1944(-)
MPHPTQYSLYAFTSALATSRTPATAPLKPCSPSSSSSTTTCLSPFSASSALAAATAAGYSSQSRPFSPAAPAAAVVASTFQSNTPSAYCSRMARILTPAMFSSASPSFFIRPPMNFSLLPSPFSTASTSTPCTRPSPSCAISERTATYVKRLRRASAALRSGLTPPKATVSMSIQNLPSRLAPAGVRTSSSTPTALTPASTSSAPLIRYHWQSLARSARKPSPTIFLVVRQSNCPSVYCCRMSRILTATACISASSSVISRPIHSSLLVMGVCTASVSPLYTPLCPDPSNPSSWAITDRTATNVTRLRRATAALPSGVRLPKMSAGTSMAMAGAAAGAGASFTTSSASFTTSSAADSTLGAAVFSSWGATTSSSRASTLEGAGRGGAATALTAAAPPLVASLRASTSCLRAWISSRATSSSSRSLVVAE